MTKVKKSETRKPAVELEVRGKSNKRFMAYATARSNLFKKKNHNK